MTRCEVEIGTTTYRGIDDQGVLQFLGIPYAAPPLGKLRFRAPMSSKLEGLVDATASGESPAQITRQMPDWAPRGDGFKTGEDCLNLNVFTPGADDARRPVIVHAFGGGFQSGSASGTFHEDAEFAQRGDVVLVRPNMRVGALGFLDLGPSMGVEDEPANRGMLDFITALEWVQDHIAAFGGDPDNVTLVGMSSGAFTIAALFGVQGTEKLFTRAWMMSGSASRMIARPTARSIADEFLGLAQVQPGDWNGLERLDTAQILEIQHRIVATHLGERNAPGGRTLGIVQDGISLNQHPLEGLSSGRFAKHQIVLGWTRDEARMWYAFGIMPDVDHREKLLASISRFIPDDPQAALRALELEFPERDFTGLEEVFLSRAVYRDPALRTALAHHGAGGLAFVYEFAWAPPFQNGRLGAAHGFDEPFVFGVSSPDRIPLLNGCERARSLTEEMNGSLYNFARTGSPGWLPVSNDNGPLKVWQ